MASQDFARRLLSPAGLALALLAGCAGFAAPALAVLVSEGGSFGANTLTRDTATGLRWLDLTLSLNRTYAQIAQELGPGGDFAGYRFATGNEVEELWENAGIDTSTSLFVAQNHQPVSALAALVGQTGSNGNCGSGCTYFYTEGWYWNGDPPPVNFLAYAEMAWFDNSAGLSGSYPQAPIGRTLTPTSLNDTAKATRGAWLIEVPEPSAAAIAGAAACTIAVLARRRARRSSRDAH